MNNYNNNSNIKGILLNSNRKKLTSGYSMEKQIKKYIINAKISNVMPKK